MIIFTDLHLRPKTADTVFGEVLPGIFEAALQDADRAVGFLGDWWHVRYRLPVDLLNASLVWLETLTEAGCQIHMISGNHDQINGAGETALEAFGHVDGVHVYTKPTVNDWGVWLPHQAAEYNSDFLYMGAPASGKVIWAHQDVPGGLMNKLIQSKSGTVFPETNRVYSGHYHKRQVVGNVTFVGAPYQTRSDEEGNVTGYGVWNSQTGNFGWVDTGWGPRHYSLDMTDPNFVYPEGMRSHDIIKVIAPSESIELVQANLAAMQLQANVCPKIKKKEARLVVPEGAGIGAFAVEYAKKFGDGLNLQRLLEIAEEVINAI